MTATTTSVLGKPLLIIAILATSVWLAAQKGCVPTPEVAPKPVTFTMREEGPALIQQAHQSFAQSWEPKSRSLKQASALLRQAADMLNKDDPLAVQLIRQAIAILKHEVNPGIDAPDYERVSMPSAFGWNKAIERKPQAVCTVFRILPCSDLGITPRFMTRNVDVPQALASIVIECPPPTSVGA